MEKVFEIQVRKVEKPCYVSGDIPDLMAGDICIVEFAKGTQDYAKVCTIFNLGEKDEKQTISGKILRKANEQDMLVIRENEILKEEAFKLCDGKIKEINLPMKLIDVTYSFDRTVITFYYWAAGRVDFRKLVKELASIFNCRIEMRQIGLRDEAKIKGGFGICGQEICCHRFLKDFEPVTMKLVKTQSLPLDMSKISGLCGRLMCCLIFESKMYENGEDEQ
ncbi:MAG TPA: regulatory iron-sulfur-containing complex subunit RicT [bacterium]|nr:regulatory iron-sulfur-containing complex subunit RicT [bacterium]HOL50096.1 regulatory iron-sulfur-containing complex subunit RicT [bacterium]HPO51433.1 regulatory iron-sulfur-containing complex subunit RicT [bacterium]HXK44571.1 regulatory iron-sulfur-containing complex subunit RicT [bacterium]